MLTLENAIEEVQENREEVMSMGHTGFFFTLTTNLLGKSTENKIKHKSFSKLLYRVRILETVANIK
jgi:fatty acid/phospholipid biosynthesis enzyme